jgi:hypothetical protein
MPRQASGAGHVDEATGRQHFHFLDQDLGVDDAARADDANLVFVQHARRDEVQHRANAVDDHGVAGVVAPMKADHDLSLLAELVDDATLAFIAPLRTDTHDIAHRRLHFLRRVSSQVTGGKGARDNAVDIEGRTDVVQVTP